MRPTHSQASSRTFYNSLSSTYDPFAVHPIRRSGFAALISGLLLIGVPLAFGSSSDVTTGLYLTVGWLAAAVFIFAVPIFIISTLEAGWHSLQCHVHPSISVLDLSPRVANLLRRHQFDTVDDIERAPDGLMLLLSNFDAEALREVRRATSLFRYAERQRRWEAERQREVEQRLAMTGLATPRLRRLRRFVSSAFTLGHPGGPRS